MSFPNRETQFKPGQSGNPSGKPKGTVHLSTMIQDMLNDEDLTPAAVNMKQSGKTPMIAIVTVAIGKAIDGDIKWAGWLAKHGYGTKVEIIQDTEEYVGTYDEERAQDFAEYLMNKK
jgi:hypothetical protein